MNTAGKPIFTERLAYHRRFGKDLGILQVYDGDDYPVFPDVPDDLFVPSDETAPGRPLWLGDPLDNYPGNSAGAIAARTAIRQNEQAATRLGLVGLTSLTPEVVATLRALKSMEERGFEHTPLELHEDLVPGVAVYLKLESMRRTGSYKERGPLAALQGDEAEVYVASAGNAAAGLAFVGSLEGLTKVTAFMAKNTPQSKQDNVRTHGARVELVDGTFAEAYEVAAAAAATNNVRFFEPYDDPAVIRGNATMLAEAMQQAGTFDMVVAPIGGGGVCAGITQYAKETFPRTRTLGVECEGQAAMHASIVAGERVRLDSVDTWTDGTATKEVGVHTYGLMRQYVDDFSTVPKVEVARAMVDLNERGIAAEPAASLALAGLRAYAKSHDLSGQKVFVPITGRNFDQITLDEARQMLRQDLVANTHYVSTTSEVRPGSVRC